MRSLFFVSLALLGCTEDPVQDPDPDPGTQIGGIDCDNDKVLLVVMDADQTPVASTVTLDFPDGDTLVSDCPAGTCNLELSGPGLYELFVDAGVLGTYQGTFVLDDSNVAGQLAPDCGDRPFHELDLSVRVVEDDGGDIFTSNIGLRAVDSAGTPMSGVATITEPGEAPYTQFCRPTRCWIDIPGMGSYDIAFAGDNGESGAVTFLVDATHHAGKNELGDDVYEAEVRLVLAP